MTNDGKNRERRGVFITVEGPEGAGKTTQVALLLEYLRGKGCRVAATREPGGTGLAEKIRDVVKGHAGEEKMHPETELLLLEAARSQHVREFILPRLEQGISVICDRFSDSTIAYQGGARGIGRTEIALLNDFAASKLVPDITFLLDIAPETGFARARERAETAGEFDRFEAEKMEFHRRVRRCFLELALTDPARIKVIDAGREPQAVHADIVSFADELVV